MPESPAVRAYRDKFRLNLSPGRRHDIEVTVTDLNLWNQVLNNWGYVKNGKWKSFNPLSVGKMLSEYERLEQKCSRSSK
jgi:hypothetical protein